MDVILASQSPRRKELLAWLVPAFEVRPADIDETPKENEDPLEYVARMAEEKAAVIAASHPDQLVIASDTTVAIGQTILGKPADAQEAEEMLQLLSGKEHLVYTSVVLQKGKHMEKVLSQAAVTFYPLSNDDISQYLSTGDYQDKAGAYGIQGPAGIFVKKIEGDYYSIVGFPVGAVNQVLKHFN